MILQVYDASDPTLAYTSSGITPGQSITGALAREAGENVGKYGYTLGDLSAGKNYSLQLATGQTFEITPADIIIEENPGYNMPYDGKPHGITVRATTVNLQPTIYYSTTELTKDNYTSDGKTDALTYAHFMDGEQRVYLGL